MIHPDPWTCACGQSVNAGQAHHCGRVYWTPGYPMEGVPAEIVEAVIEDLRRECDALAGPRAELGSICHHKVAQNSAWRCAICFDAELEALRKERDNLLEFAIGVAERLGFTVERTRTK